MTSYFLELLLAASLDCGAGGYIPEAAILRVVFWKAPTTRARSQGQANASAVKVSQVRAESKPRKRRAAARVLGLVKLR